MFLLVTRTVTDDIKKTLQSLLNADIDAYVIVDKDNEPSSKRYIRYNSSEIDDFGFTRLNVTHRTNELIYRVTGWDKALYHAYMSKEDYVWICEDDMYWNRPSVVKMILDAAKKNKSNLIATTPLSPTYEENPRWYHWPKTDWITNNKEHWFGSFNQFCRLSKRLIQKIYEFAQERKNLILHETLFGTLCKINNYKISYLQDLKLPIYYSIRWQPDYIDMEIEELLEENPLILIHPVKSKYTIQLRRKEFLLAQQFENIYK